VERLWTEADLECVLVKLGDGEADAVDGNGITNMAVCEDVRCVDGHAEAVSARLRCIMGDDGFDDADGFDLSDSGIGTCE
jgi:hypothetical protein